MLASIPAPWILWDIWRLFHDSIGKSPRQWPRPMASRSPRTAFRPATGRPGRKSLATRRTQCRTRFRCAFSWKTIESSRDFPQVMPQKTYDFDGGSGFTIRGWHGWNQSIETPFKLQWQLWKPVWAQWTPWEPTKTPLHRPLKSCKLAKTWQKHGNLPWFYSPNTHRGAVQVTHWYNAITPVGIWPTGRLLVLDWTFDSSLAARISAIQAVAGWIMVDLVKSPRFWWNLPKLVMAVT